MNNKELFEELMEAKLEWDKTFCRIVSELIDVVKQAEKIEIDSQFHDCFICKKNGIEDMEVKEIADHWAHMSCLREAANKQESTIL